MTVDIAGGCGHRGKRGLLLGAACVLLACGGGGSSGTGGGEAASGGGGGSGGGAGDVQLSVDTVLFLRRAQPGRDVLMAHTLSTGREWVVTDLTGDGSQGASIDGYALSAGRREIVLASRYGATPEDAATGLATNAIWRLSADGTDFKRLTPTFPNTGAGRDQFSIWVGNPTWDAFSMQVVFEYGEWWREGSAQKGRVVPHRVLAIPGQTPAALPSAPGCSARYPGLDPMLGGYAFIHTGCEPGAGPDGVFLYPPDGSAAPTMAVESAHVIGSVEVAPVRPAFYPDGESVFFVGGVAQTEWRPALLLYDVSKKTVGVLLAPPEGAAVDGVAVSRDARYLVFALRDTADSHSDLRVVDLTAEPLTDAPLTQDGQSYAPVF